MLAIAGLPSALGAGVVAFVVTRSLVVSAVTAGFIIGAAALWLVYREVVGLDAQLDRQDARITVVEGTVRHIEERWSSGDR